MDWNQDGNLDILSGCYWTDASDSGHIQILRGKGPLKFEKAESLLNAKGVALSNFPIDDDNKGSKQTETICTHQHAVDYDADGDLDLVVGCFATSFYLYENNGSAGDPLLGEPIELPIKSPSYHSAPHLVDWDGDGDLDLLSGTGDGGAVWSQNVGTRQQPEWSEFTTLIPAPKAISAQSPASKNSLQPSRASRIWATDWNRDGKLDLLLGDAASVQKHEDNEAAVDVDATKKQMEESRELAKPLRAELRKLRIDGVKVDDERMISVRAELAKLSDTYLKLSRSLRKTQQIERTGFVWLYLQTDAPEAVARVEQID